MNKLVVLVSLAVMASGARLDHLVQGGYSGGNGGGAPFHFENVNNGDGNYRFSYDTPTGISAHESGSPRAAGSEGPAVTAEGGFSYRAPDGQQISLTYTADENGFHPTGSHLPTPPPIPEAILRSLEYNRQHPSSEGSYNGRRSSYY
ncbi:pupal cuticle protein 20-like [Nymphalis io]|uniref:pupal cuticle protein 20-like n=1 Tax=Inachis io TaxID=171585 RepID=UPI00216783D1|nr:pupal cuticle protein 20-like [Nymphalis io]